MLWFHCRHTCALWWPTKRLRRPSLASLRLTATALRWFSRSALAGKAALAPTTSVSFHFDLPTFGSHSPFPQTTLKFCRLSLAFAAATTRATPRWYGLLAV